VKDINERGMLLMPKDKESGVKFLRLLLECLFFWSEQYPKHKNEPTNFKKIYQ